MSYILDALRRAEAERERGAVPSLASQQHSIEVEDEVPQRSRVLVWAVIGLAFALIATLAWTLLGGHSAPSLPIAEGPVTIAPPPAPAAVPQSLAEIAATPSATVAPAPAPAAQTVVASPSRSTTKAPVPARVPTPRPVAAPAAKTAPSVALAAPKAEPRKSGVTAAPLAPATAASEPRIYAQSELPEDIRRELPRVAINGSSYSGDAASRMVMVNGQVFHEGDQLAANLVLDKIRRRSAVLAYKGFRYEVMF
ncbi:MAG: general secretion pathway protein GspB [Caldimonas sp.]